MIPVLEGETEDFGERERSFDEFSELCLRFEELGR